MAKPEKFVLVCLNERPEGHPKGSCSQMGGSEIFSRFKEILEEKGLNEKIRIIKTGCMGVCYEGPVVAVFPDNCWYGGVTPTDVRELIDNHLIEGEAIEGQLLKGEEWG